MDIKDDKLEIGLDRLLRLPRTQEFKTGGIAQSWVGEEFGELEPGETYRRYRDISGKSQEGALVLRIERPGIISMGSYGAVVLGRIQKSYRTDLWTELEKIREEETRPGIFKRNVVEPLIEAKKIIYDCIEEEDAIARENAFSLLISNINSVWESRDLLNGYKKSLVVRLKALCIGFLRAGLEDAQYEYFSLLIDHIVRDEDINISEYRGLIRKGLEVGLKTTELLKLEAGWYPEYE